MRAFVRLREPKPYAIVEEAVFQGKHKCAKV